jgi:hypothetical protein
MGITYSMYERSERYEGFCGGNLKKRYHIEHIGVVGRIILK